MRRSQLGVLAALVVAVAVAAFLYTGKQHKERDARDAAADSEQQERSQAILRLAVSVNDDTEEAHSYGAWLEEELRYLLSRNGVPLAYPQGAHHQDETSRLFTLRLRVPSLHAPGVLDKGAADKNEAARSRIQVQLSGPDERIQKSAAVNTAPLDRLRSVTALSEVLPSLLPRAGSGPSMSSFIGTSDAQAYEELARAQQALPNAIALATSVRESSGIAAAARALEKLTASDPKFARAWALLARAYIGVGGKDHAALLQIADAAAAKGLVFDHGLPDAHVVLSLTAYERAQWPSADEHLRAALQSDPGSAAGLTASACLNTNTGRMDKAIKLGQQAMAENPSNGVADECLAYARIGAGGNNATQPPHALSSDPQGFGVARAYGFAALLDGRLEDARGVFKTAYGAEPPEWLNALLAAVADPGQVPTAIRALTKAASEDSIDSTTEILCGLALKQPDFVFNRLMRLYAHREALPLHMLWLPQTAFLRDDSRFKWLIEKIGLRQYWDEDGLPDYCGSEPSSAGCQSPAGPRAPRSTEDSDD